MIDDVPEPTLHDVIDRLDGIDDHVGSLCARVGDLEKSVSGLEKTVNRKFAAMGAGFRMMSDQLTDSP